MNKNCYQLVFLHNVKPELITSNSFEWGEYDYEYVLDMCVYNQEDYEEAIDYIKYIVNYIPIKNTIPTKSIHYNFLFNLIFTNQKSRFFKDKRLIDDKMKILLDMIDW